MSRTKGATNTDPTYDASIYVRCFSSLKKRLKRVHKDLRETDKVRRILEEYLDSKNVPKDPKT